MTLTKKLLGSFAALTLALGFFATNAQASTTWNVSGTYDVAFSCSAGCSGGPYDHKMTLTEDSSGNVTGTGGYPYSGPFQYSWHITSGMISGNTLSLTAVYDTDASAKGAVMHMTATIDSTGHITNGMWDDNYGGTSRAGTWTTTGTATTIGTTTIGTGFSGEGRISASNKGKPDYTFDVEDGVLTIVNHQSSPPCVYHINVSDLTFGSNTAGFTNLAGKAGKTACAPLTATFTDNSSVNDIVNIGGTDYTVSGGMFTVTSNSTSSLKTFSATNSSYYNGPTDSAPLYASGPISFTWDNSGNVTGGYYTEQVPANTGTLNYNLITGGSVSGNNVNLTFYRDNPTGNNFTFTGTLVGGMLTGQLDGPYYFSATGTTM